VPVEQATPAESDAAMVALYRNGTRTVTSLSSNYKGPPSDFAVVVPVPVVLKKEQVNTLSPGVFAKLDAFTAPRLVEYWEHDPCNTLDYTGIVGAGGSPETASAGEGDAMAGAGVKVEAQFIVGEYDVTILSATESDALEGWLREHGFALPKNAAEALAPYVKEQMKFFVAKVAIDRTTRDATGAVVLSPLRFEYESTEFRLPVRLGLLNARGKQDLIVFVLGDKRYEVANYPSIAAPTNLEITASTRKVFSSFYATLFDAAIARAGGNGVVTEFAGSPWACNPCTTSALNGVELTSLGVTGQDGVWPAVITRLHARYDATTLTEDLVFRAEGPIAGGSWGSTNGAASDPVGKPGAQSTLGNNMFSARYVIRHPWKGQATCANPEWSLWEDHPPASAQLPPSAAFGLAAAMRGTLKLHDHVLSGLDDVDAWDRAAQQGATVPNVKRTRACGCELASADAAEVFAGVSLSVSLFGLVLVRRRRRRA
jgi:hypothetical protein